MKVKELIQELGQADPEADVVVCQTDLVCSQVTGVTRTWRGLIWIDVYSEDEVDG